MEFKILILGWSNFVQRKVFPSLKANKRIKNISVASKHLFEKNSDVLDCVYQDYIEALDRFDGEIIYISATNQEHDSLLIESLNRGFHTIIDKPAILKESTKTMIQKQKYRNLLVCEALYFKHHRAWDFVTNYFTNSCLPDMINIDFLIPSPSESNFRQKFSPISGAIADMGIYVLSSASSFWDNEIKGISGYQIKNRMGISQYFSACIRYKNDKLLTATCGFGFNYKHQISFSNSKDTIEFQRPFSLPSNVLPKITKKNSNTEENINLETDNSCVSFFNDVLKDLELGIVSHHRNNVIVNFDLLKILDERLS